MAAANTPLATHSPERLNQLVADAWMVACPIAITVIAQVVVPACRRRHSLLPSQIGCHQAAHDALIATRHAHMITETKVTPLGDTVLPERPVGTETMNEEQLALLITRDAMVGVAKVTLPSSRGNA